MDLLVWIAVIGVVLFLIWYGYGLMVRGPEASAADAGGSAQCHLCRRTMPIGEMVTRQKMAGFENHFCGDCIEELHRDYTALRKGRSPAGIVPARN